MADLFAPGLVDMIVELERDLLARRRVYANRQLTRRLAPLTVERRIAILEAVLANLRAQADPSVLDALDKIRERKREDREARAARRRARLNELVPPTSAGR